VARSGSTVTGGSFTPAHASAMNGDARRASTTSPCTSRAWKTILIAPWQSRCFRARNPTSRFASWTVARTALPSADAGVRRQDARLGWAADGGPSDLLRCERCRSDVSAALKEAGCPLSSSPATVSLKVHDRETSLLFGFSRPGVSAHRRRSQMSLLELRCRHVKHYGLATQRPCTFFCGQRTMRSFRRPRSHARGLT
jgi:hypothetical protein